ncbi:MAG: sigma-54-dependent Fis family transcriptional regulator [Deltaproteobacteria bacterium]|nr:sigma-54-dependent Fis family transcriptional regulator [Deltaproteobacteria bacterium]
MMVAAIQRHGHTVCEAASGEEALGMAARRRPALVFLDVRLGPSRMDGLETLVALREQDADLPVVLVTGYGDVKQAVQAMKSGALDFLEKPVDLSEIRRILDAVAPLDRVADPIRGFPFGGIVPAPGPFRDMLELLELAAPSLVPLLVLGESGTGKELVAAWAHAHGPHPGGPLVKVNCAAIPGELLEAEMFGVEKGAFTGALRATRGRFRDADGGTLLLDEIGEMDLSLQAKLLRVLQDKWVQPVGGSQGHTVDVRVVATTNRDLHRAIEQGRFREDLYFRLAVFELLVPPLRDRPADILPLARHLAQEAAQGRPVRLAPETEARLQAHPWTGNVRELRNVVERAVIVARGGVLQPSHLPPGFDEASEPPMPTGPERPTLQEQERRLILETLAANEGNRTRTARDLGLSRRALYYKLERYGIG